MHLEPVTVLLAEDHAVVREGTRHMLEDDELITVVGEAVDGPSAVEMSRDLSPDVLLLDMSLPILNGIEVTQAVRALLSPPHVLILSAYDDTDYVTAALAAGAGGYLLKTAEFEDLVKAIHTVASGQSALAPEVAGKVVAQFTSGKSLPEVLANANDQFDGLTDRELGILRLVGKGLSNKQIGKELYISDRTVQAHLSNIFSKLGVSSRTEAVMHAVRKNWIKTGQ